MRVLENGRQICDSCGHIVFPDDEAFWCPCQEMSSGTIFIQAGEDATASGVRLLKMQWKSKARLLIYGQLTAAAC